MSLQDAYRGWKAIPAMELGNHQAAYEYIAGREPDAGFLDRIHNVSSYFLDVTTVFDPPEARETIGEHLEQGGLAHFAVKHVSIIDHFVLAAAFNEVPEFAPVRSHVTLPAKVEMYWSLFQRPVVALVNAPPAIRASDIKYSDDPVVRQHQENLRKLFAGATIAMQIAMFNKGYHGVIYPERGGRGLNKQRQDPLGKVIKMIHKIMGQAPKRDVSTVREFYDGIGHISLGVEEPEKILVVPTALDYGGNKSRSRHPIAVFHEPFLSAGMSVMKIRDRAREGMQAGMLTAGRLSLERSMQS